MNESQKEIFKDVIDYEGLYIVSNLGKVYNIKKQNKKECSFHLNHKGYACLGLYNKGKTKLYKLHRIIAEAFLGKSSLQVNHKDGNKLNNNILNLEFLTDKQNKEHGKSIFLYTKGEKAWSSKLTWKNIKKIREEQKISQRKLAKKYNVNPSTISRIINNKIWRTSGIS